MTEIDQPEYSPTPSLTTEIVDKFLLAELHARWCRGIDRGDRELLLTCYAEQAQENHGEFVGSAREFIDYIVARRRTYTRYHHMTGQQLFEIDRDSATGETYYDFHGVFGSEKQLRKSYGRYLDHYIRSDAGWKILERTVVGDWRGELLCSEPTLHSELGYPAPALSPDDPIYGYHPQVQGS